MTLRQCAVLSYYALVSPNQLRKFLESAGLTVREAAALLDMQERQWFRYLAGDAEIPRVVEYALRWAVQARKESRK